MAMDSKVIGAQNVARMCIVCGLENKSGLGARFFELENGELVGVFTPAENHQSYPGRLHGGIASMILDEAIGRAINVKGREVWSVTIELTTRYRKPVPLDEEIRAVCRIVNENSRTFEGTGEIVLSDGTVAVEAKGRYMKLPAGKIADDAYLATDWFEDTRPLPDALD